MLDSPNPFPAQELALPPTNRFNIGFNVDGPRFLGSATVNYSDKAFWSDVLIESVPRLHGRLHDGQRQLRR